MNGPLGARIARLTGLTILLGVAVGVVWYLVAPTPGYVVRAGGVGFTKDLPGEFVAMDGWFAVLGLIAGIVLAVAVLRWGGTEPVIILVAAVLGLLGAVIAWRLGHLLGPGTPDLGVREPVGRVQYGPLDLNAKGVLFIWPVVTLGILTFALAWTTREPKAVVTEPPAGIEP